MPREDPKAAARQARLLAKTNEVQGHAHMILHGEERLRAGAMLKLADLSADPAKQRGVVKDGGLQALVSCLRDDKHPDARRHAARAVRALAP